MTKIYTFTLKIEQIYNIHSTIIKTTNTYQPRGGKDNFHFAFITFGKYTDINDNALLIEKNSGNYNQQYAKENNIIYCSQLIMLNQIKPNNNIFDDYNYDFNANFVFNI